PGSAPTPLDVPATSALIASEGRVPDPTAIPAKSTPSPDGVS
ncbi:MAG: hypothetical protein JWR62_2219, partial [Modestobacter sp.]|nr:hypothetical protein [Modestobacter sp.]